tara:strand:+ start:468 stop:2039 length:1572 start_codon:yes stop_codon:yes gene_type:complete
MEGAKVSDYAVEMRGISKRFGGVHALKGVDLAVRSGEVHALLGENGAGKSTILKVLQGVLTPDAGSIVVNGREVSHLTPRTAADLGIGMIFQEMSLVPSLTVAQNIFLAREPLGGGGLIADREMERRARDIFASMGVAIDPGVEVANLSAGQQQLTEIAKALSRNVNVLILDEPTSALTSTEVGILFDLLAALRKEGKAIIYVSHRMDEIFRVASMATVLRDGERVASRPIAQYSLGSLIADIMGKASRDMTEFMSASNAGEEVVLRLRDVSIKGREGSINLELHRGEVLGLAGLMGAGRSRLARILFGLERDVSGTIELHGKPVVFESPGAAKALGFALVPEDRRRQGLVLEHSIEDNIALPVLERVSGRVFMRGSDLTRLAQRTIEELSIKTSSERLPANALSGGNQQKIVIGKWLAAAPDILIMDEPTAGIDIGSKTEIIQLVRRLAAEGRSIIFISSELAELLAVSDRIAVLDKGSVRRIVDRSELTREGTETAEPETEFQRAEHRLQLVLQERNSINV